MNRRRFLSLAGLSLGGIALTQAIPLGRVWSFPKKIVIGPKPPRGWEVAPDGLMSFDQQNQFAIYRPDGGLHSDTVSYFWKEGRVFARCLPFTKNWKVENTPAEILYHCN